ncbi:MAG: sugar ABC transporter permease [Anaerolineales bacterium]
MTALQRREAFAGYAYISPWLLGFLIFSLFPFVASLVLSLMDYAIISPPRFVGINNYATAFVKDELFWPSLGRTAYYAIVSVPLGIIGSLLCALLLNQKLYGTTVWRTLYFLPSLTPTVALALLWKWLLQPDFGLVNYLLGKIGIAGPGWLGSSNWAIPALIVMNLWGSVGGGRMIIFLAGLQGVPQELYEAANMDGAGPWSKFLHVTLPMISPTMFFNLVMGLIGALATFDVAYVATEGGPNYATWFYTLHLFNQAFKYLKMGYASALAWVFTIVVVFLTFLQLKASDKWVFYSGAM